MRGGASLIVLLLAAAAPLPAALPAANGANMQVLLGTFMPEKMWIQYTLNNFNDSLDENSASDARLLHLYRQYPGLRTEVVKRIGSEMSRLVQQDVPGLRQQISGALSEQMSAKQIAALARFVNRALGREMITIALDAVLKGDDTDFTETREFEKLNAKLLASPPDVAAVTDLQSSGALEQINAVGSKVGAIRDAWEVRFRRDHAAELKDLAVRAAATYIAEQNVKAELR